MDFIDINYSSLNNNIYKGHNQKESNSIFKSKVIIKYDFAIKDSNSNMTLLDLKKEINKKFNIKEDEYELFIGEHSLKLLSNEIPIVSLLNKYKTNNIKIQSYKTILDSKRDIINYENILSKKISLKDDEIKMLNVEYEKIKEDLNNI
jgi:hypothetical protein